MSEQTIHEAIQATIQSLSAFDDADVTINDWRILDGEIVRSPYVIIETSDDFESRQQSRTPNTIWTIRVWLFVQFSQSSGGWKESLDNFRTYRQNIIDEFNTVGTDRSPGGGSVTADLIRSGTGILPYEDKYIPADLRNEALPLFLYQLLLMTVEEF